MRFLPHLLIAVVSSFAAADLALADKTESDWYNRTRWSFTNALERTPPSLIPHRTIASVKLFLTADGQIKHVTVSSEPTSEKLNAWIKTKLDSVDGINPHPDGKAETVTFSIDYAGKR